MNKEKQLKNMKKIIVTALLIFCVNASLMSQEKYGKTLNIGAGIGYYGVGTSPALSVNYEFDVFKNFTLAPFITVWTDRRYTYWGDGLYPYRDYSYRETVIPIGAKGTYYFDELFDAGDKWDFYAAASLGFAIRTVKWEAGYYGNRDVSSSPLYGSLHIGSELHLNTKVGLFLDLSTGISTFGLAIHM
jgi:hypothetical protein